MCMHACVGGGAEGEGEGPSEVERKEEGWGRRVFFWGGRMGAGVGGIERECGREGKHFSYMHAHIHTLTFIGQALHSHTDIYFHAQVHESEARERAEKEAELRRCYPHTHFLMSYMNMHTPLHDGMIKEAELKRCCYPHSHLFLFFCSGGEGGGAQKVLPTLVYLLSAVLTFSLLPALLHLDTAYQSQQSLHITELN